jgi:hypothetical protein
MRTPWEQRPPAAVKHPSGRERLPSGAAGAGFGPDRRHGTQTRGGAAGVPGCSDALLFTERRPVPSEATAPSHPERGGGGGPGMPGERHDGNAAREGHGRGGRTRGPRKGSAKTAGHRPPAAGRAEQSVSRALDAGRWEEQGFEGGEPQERARLEQCRGDRDGSNPPWPWKRRRRSRAEGWHPRRRRHRVTDRQQCPSAARVAGNGTDRVGWR